MGLFSRFVKKKSYTTKGLEFFGLSRAAVDDRFTLYRSEFGLTGRT